MSRGYIFLKAINYPLPETVLQQHSIKTDRKHYLQMACLIYSADRRHAQNTIYRNLRYRITQSFYWNNNCGLLIYGITYLIMDKARVR